jgi:signal peptidase II
MSDTSPPEAPRAANRGRRGGRKKAGKTRSLFGQLLPWLGLAGLVIICDQATKFQIQRSLQPGDRIVVIQDWFDLTLVFNPGAAFSFLANASGWQRWFFIGIGAVATSYLLWLLIRHSGQRLFSLGLSLILGGAIGNVIDRLRFGAVVDFLRAHAWGWDWYVFNIADAGIVCGVAVLLADALFRRPAGPKD